jgi:hypothetical protein
VAIGVGPTPTGDGRGPGPGPVGLRAFALFFVLINEARIITASENILFSVTFDPRRLKNRLDKSLLRVLVNFFSVAVRADSVCWHSKQPCRLGVTLRCCIARTCRCLDQRVHELLRRVGGGAGLGGGGGVGFGIVDRLVTASSLATERLLLPACLLVVLLDDTDGRLLVAG